MWCKGVPITTDRDANKFISPGLLAMYSLVHASVFCDSPNCVGPCHPPTVCVQLFFWCPPVGWSLVALFWRTVLSDYSWTCSSARALLNMEVFWATVVKQAAARGFEWSTPHCGTAGVLSFLTIRNLPRRLTRNWPRCWLHFTQDMTLLEATWVELGEVLYLTNLTFDMRQKVWRLQHGDLTF